MNPNREELLIELALEKPVEERAAFLKGGCGDSREGTTAPIIGS
jgi:hypothetical protein